MSYIGNTPTTQSFISGTDYFNGTGAQTAFTLSRTVASVNDIQAVVNNVVQVPNDAYTISGTTITFTSAPSAGTQNVYVRYLSTTTQAITPSQNTVSWSTLDSNVQGDLGISFKNKIINGNMVIDQRNAGASVTVTTDNTQFSVDRFILRTTGSSKYSAQQNAGSVTPPVGFSNYLGITSLAATSLGATDYYAVEQRIEAFNYADLNWGTANAKTVTLSFWVRSSLTGTFGGNLRNSGSDYCYPYSYTISAANTWEYKTVTITGPTSGTWVASSNGTGIQCAFSLGTGSTYSGTAGSWASTFYGSATGAVSVVGTNGATFYLTGVQLEVGTQATTFTTAGGSYGAELALCQRYYYVHASGANSPITTGFYYSSSQIRCHLTYKQSMRTAPTAVVATGTDYYYLGINSSNDVFNAIAINENSVNGAEMYSSAGTVSGTVGQAGTLNCGNASSSVAFSAEL